MQNTQRFVYQSVPQIICSDSALLQLNATCEKLGIQHPLIVTDQGIVDAGLLSSLLASFNEEVRPIVFDQIVADPPEQVIHQCREVALSEKVDGIIGFGGGSSLDSAKIIAVLAHADNQGLALQSMYGVEQFSASRLPLILIPTTAGTGSEVTPVAIVTTSSSSKAGIVSPVLLPDVAILDASLTLSLPAHITAATGIDAMVHAIEAYTSAIKKNAYSDMLATQALTLLSENIEMATLGLSTDHNMLCARQNMLLGACLAGQAFANAPVGAVHALAYPLGGHFHLPHGLSNALVLTAVMRFNLPEAAQMYAELMPLIVPSSQQAPCASTQQQAEMLIDYLQQLMVTLGLPLRLRDCGVKRESLEALANDAMLQTRLLVNNPKEVRYEDALFIYQQVF